MACFSAIILDIAGVFSFDRIDNCKGHSISIDVSQMSGSFVEGCVE